MLNRSTIRTLHCPAALLPNGWAARVNLTFDAEGWITKVEADAEPKGFSVAPGPVLPGMPNVHSHAFQRAMAGRTHRRGPSADSFWTWRAEMYRFALGMTPEAVEATAAWLYLDLLRHGYTSVGEFHYLHHDHDGRPYAQRAELAHRIAAAAQQTGLGLTLLPVLYTYGGFGEQPPHDAQRRFLNDLAGYAKIAEDLFAAYRADPQCCVGVAPHSLRAVGAEQWAGLLALRQGLAPEAPLHIHVAEQVPEVEACLAWSGQRPVAWLLDHQPVDARWCLIHATHMTEAEARALAASGATAGLCPTTEADLGDGVFPAPVFLEAGGRFGIGSDSNTRLDPMEELRLLEYEHRLARQARNVLRASETDHVGTGLYLAACDGGAHALGRPVGRLAAGRRADFVVLDAEHPLLAGLPLSAIADTFVFAGGPALVRDVYVGGEPVIQEGRHAEEAAIREHYRTTLAALLREA